MSRIVVHNEAEKRGRELAAQQAASITRRAPFFAGAALPPPDKSSRLVRLGRLSAVHLEISRRERQRRASANETARPFSRKKHYYEVLELDRACSAAEVRRAFRRLSLQFHPDKQLGKSDEERRWAARMFDEIKEAHECLAHEPTRREYDQILRAQELAADVKFSLDDIEAVIRAAQPPRRHAAPVYRDVDVTIFELHRGCVKHVQHTRVEAGGRSRALTLTLNVVAGAAAGDEYIFRNMGDAQGAAAGHVICVLREVPDERLCRQGDDLVLSSGVEAPAGALLVALRVALIGGDTRFVIAHTLEPSLLSDGNVGQVRLRGCGIRRSAHAARSRQGDPTDAPTVRSDATNFAASGAARREHFQAAAPPREVRVHRA